MSALRFRPEVIRVGWRPVVAFAAALYVLRSALRGWDFRPDIIDVVVFGGLAVLLILRAVLQRTAPDHDEHTQGGRDTRDDGDAR